MDSSIRTKSLIIGFICFLGYFAVHANDEELFLRGNKYYEQKDYDNALVSYTAIMRKGRAVLYNMGNCYYHKEEYPQALVYWNRAERGATYHEAITIARNKDHLLKKLGRPTEDNFWQKIYKQLCLYSSYFSLLCLQLFFLMIWYLLLFLYNKKRDKKIIALSACLFFISISMLLGVKYTENSTICGIVTQNTSVFAGPDNQFHVLASLDSPQQVIIQTTREGWYKIRYADIIGWVEAGTIQVV